MPTCEREGGVVRAHADERARVRPSTREHRRASACAPTRARECGVGRAPADERARIRPSTRSHRRASARAPTSACVSASWGARLPTSFARTRPS